MTPDEITEVLCEFYEFTQGRVEKITWSRKKTNDKHGYITLTGFEGSRTILLKTFAREFLKKRKGGN